MQPQPQSIFTSTITIAAASTTIEADLDEGEVLPEEEQQQDIDRVVPDQHLESEKVYIRGLDNLTTNDIRTYAHEHFPVAQHVKVEWIDDSSANIVYADEDTAAEALRAFAAVEERGFDAATATTLRPARRLSTNPAVELAVRLATVTDVKKPRAHEASRFYLLNPDKDPWEKRRTRGRRDGRDGNDDGKRRRGNGDKATATFDVNMYDDDAGIADTDAKSGGDDGYERRRRKEARSRPSPERQRRKRDLFDDDDISAVSSRRNRGILRRDRSMSPPDEDSGDGRLRFGDGDRPSRKRSRRRRSPSLPLSHEKKNIGKELFPTSGGTGGSKTLLQSSNGLNSNAHAASATTASSSFTSTTTTKYSSTSPVTSKKSNGPRELFPHKTNVSNHRRTGAFDAADGTAERYSPKKKSSVFSYDDEDGDDDMSLGLERDVRSGEGAALAARITRGSVSSVGSNGMGRRRSDAFGSAGSGQDGQRAARQAGFNIRGIADKNNNGNVDAGFSIQGAAAAMTDAAPITKELFPSKTSGLKSSANEGKELFGQKIRGRGGQRWMAKDMLF